MSDLPKDPDDLTATDFARLRDAMTAAPAAADDAFSAAVERLTAAVDAIVHATPDDRPDREAELLNDGAMLRALGGVRARRNEVEAALRHLRAYSGGASFSAQVVNLVKLAGDEARAHLRVAAPGEGIGLTGSLPRSLRDHEVPVLVAPDGWLVTDDGVFKANGDGDTRLNHRPLLITGCLNDLYSSEQYLHLEWPTRHGWAQHIVSRGAALDAKGLQTLSKIGAPVSGSNAGRAVAYLEAFEAANWGRMPHAHASSRMGWCGERGRFGFLVGKTLVRADGDVDVASRRGPTEWGDDWVHLDVSGGFDQVVDGYVRGGTFDAWRDAIEMVRPHPVAFLALYAGLVAPLLGVVQGAPNFIVDYAFTSSTGKTTTLRIPASIWGYPEDKDPSGIIGNWDFTATSLERTLAFHSFLPVLLDDTKRAKNPEWVIPTALYMVAQGRGKGRGSIDGVRETATWRTVVLSTGEVPVTSFSQDVGARARVISIREKPFGDTTPETRAFVDRLTLDLLDNHGHAGPMVVRWLLQQRDRWPRFQARFEALRAEWGERIGTNHFGGRAAPYLALLDMAAGIAEQVLGIARCEAALDVALEAARSSAADADRAAAAIEAVWGWSVSHRSRFSDRWLTSQDEPHGGWAGAVERPFKDSPVDAICFLPHVLEDVLRGLGFDTHGTLTEWWERGWLRSNEGGDHRKQKRRRMKVTVGGGARVRTVAIRMDAIERVCGREEGNDG